MELRIAELGTSTAEAFGPFRTYLLSRGLLMNFRGTEVVATDGVGSSTSIPIASEPNEWDLFPNDLYLRYFVEVLNKLGVKLVGFHDDLSGESAFRVGEGAISAGFLSETLLRRLLRLETLIGMRALQQSGIADFEMRAGREICANIEENISYGKAGLADVELLIDKLKQTSIPITEAYFLHNANSIAEDLRHALLAACHHFQDMNRTIRELNETSTSYLGSGESAGEIWESRLYSPIVDAVSYAYTSSVISCYTALDLLYEYFVYLTREPFLNPEFPANLHFPDAPGRTAFQAGGQALPSDPSNSVLPYAIANLEVGQFTALRKVRNLLVHNMAADSLRPRVHIGRKLPPVNHEPLQYVQYLSFDIDSDGIPIAHPWIRRFYQGQTDAQHNMLDWLELTWQCALDTIEWLIVRWANHTSGS